MRPSWVWVQRASWVLAIVSFLTGAVTHIFSGLKEWSLSPSIFLAVCAFFLVIAVVLRRLSARGRSPQDSDEEVASPEDIRKCLIDCAPFASLDSSIKNSIANELMKQSLVRVGHYGLSEGYCSRLSFDIEQFANEGWRECKEFSTFVLETFAAQVAEHRDVTHLVYLRRDSRHEGPPEFLVEMAKRIHLKCALVPIHDWDCYHQFRDDLRDVAFRKVILLDPLALADRQLERADSALLKYCSEVHPFALFGVTGVDIRFQRRDQSTVEVPSIIYLSLEAAMSSACVQSQIHVQTPPRKVKSI